MTKTMLVQAIGFGTSLSATVRTSPNAGVTSNTYGGYDYQRGTLRLFGYSGSYQYYNYDIVDEQL